MNKILYSVMLGSSCVAGMVLGKHLLKKGWPKEKLRNVGFCGILFGSALVISGVIENVNNRR